MKLQSAQAFATSIQRGYRPDIDGLRAVAVLSVLLFHYGATWIPGGFVGVDVFFVISGYLITKHLAEDITRNGYSIAPLLLRFYNKRIRRIVPAFASVLAATVAAGWFILLPGDYSTTGASASYSAFGLGNLYFYWHTGYFDRAAGMHPLLHTWSLGVEEQFYFAWPFLLAGIMWIVRQRRLLVLAVVSFLIAFSLAYSVFLIGTNPKAAFYLPLPRAWELGAGAAIAFAAPINRKWLADLAGAVGLILILASLFLLNGGETSLGLKMIPAIFGSAMMVWPKIGNLPARLLAVKPMVGIGLISYSLYLWHWPLLVLFRNYNNGAMPTPYEAAILTFTAIGLACLSWKYVELPARRARVSSIAAILAGFTSASAIAFAGIMIVQSAGFKNRVRPDVLQMSSLDVMWDWPCPYAVVKPELGSKRPYCVVGAPWETAKRRAIIWGDSHAQHLTPLIQAAASGHVSYLLYNPCPPASGKTTRRINPGEPDFVKHCEWQRSLFLKALHEDSSIEAAILVSAWGPLAPLVSRSDGMPFANGLSLIHDGIAELLTDMPPEKTVLLVGQFPYPESDPVPCEIAEGLRLLRRKCGDLGRDIYASTVKTVEPVNADFLALRDQFEHLSVILPSRKLCNETSCMTRIDGVSLYRDGSHLRRNLPNHVMKQLADISGLSEQIDQLEKSERPGLATQAMSQE